MSLLYAIYLLSISLLGSVLSIFKIPTVITIGSLIALVFNDIRQKDYTAVKWLKYYRYGLKLYPINQSTKDYIRLHVLLYQNTDTHSYLECTQILQIERKWDIMLRLLVELGMTYRLSGGLYLDR